MFLGLWGRMRKRRDEKRKEYERLQEEKREARERMLKATFDEFALAREEQRQRQFKRDMEALKVSSLDARRDRTQGVLTARRATETRVSQSDTDMIAAQQFIQSVQESASQSCGESSHSSSGPSSSSSDCGSSGGDSGGGSCGCD